jgi:hypothetical protein
MLIGNETVGTVDQDNLVYDDKFPIDVKSVTLAAGQGVLKRGTVIAAITDGDSVVWGGDAGQTADGILCDDVDTGTAGAVSGVVYRSGHFIRQMLIVSEGATLSASAEVELRNGGVYLSNAVL